MECGPDVHRDDAALTSGHPFACKPKSRCTSGLAPQSIGGRGNAVPEIPDPKGRQCLAGGVNPRSR